NPTGYGRILRNEQGQVTKIVEEKDGSTEQRQVNEINTGILAAPTKLMREWLKNLRNENAQREYYLTDIVAMAVKQGVRINTVHPGNEWEVMGINSKLQQAELERVWQIELANRLLKQGVTLADPARLDIRGQVNCDRDVEIDVGCIFEGTVSLGQGVKVVAYSIV